MVELARTESNITPLPSGELLGKRWLNEKEAAAVTGRALSTLRNDRHLRRGIPYLVVGGRSIRYRAEDVVNFMERRRIVPEEVAG